MLLFVRDVISARQLSIVNKRQPFKLFNGMKIQRKVSRLVENESEILCNYLLEKIPFGRANVFVKVMA